MLSSSWLFLGMERRPRLLVLHFGDGSYSLNLSVALGFSFDEMLFLRILEFQLLHQHLRFSF